MIPHEGLLFRSVLYPISENFSSWAFADVAVEGEKIIEIGPELSSSGRRCLDCSGLILLPGFYNMHTHAHDMLWRGAREGAGVDRSWPDWFWRTYHSVSLDESVAAATAAYVDSLCSGTTFVVDHLRATLPGDPFSQALSMVGLSGRVHASGSHGPGRPLCLPQETDPWFEAALERAARLPCCPIMLHAQETPLRLEKVYRRCGRSTVELLDDHGLLHSQTFLVHLCEHSEADLERIAARGAHLVVTPTAEMKLGERPLDPERVRPYGLRLLLGTDGPAYNNGNDLFAEMKLLALLWANRHGPSSVKVEEILASVTWHASEAVERSAGRIRVGDLADMICLAGNTLTLQPLVKEPFENIAAQLIYAANRADVRHVVVGGQLIVENSRCLTVREDAILQSMKQAASQHFSLYP